MIIDNAVVVFEELNPRLPAVRDSRVQHIKKHLPRTLVPVLGSTFTTVGIFVPLFFAMEELQIFLVPLAVALSLTLISSVFIALSWIPYALIWLVPSSQQQGNKSKSSRKSLFKYVRRPMLGVFTWRRRLRWFFYGALIILLGLPLFAIEEPDWETDTAWPEFTQMYFDNRNEIDPIIGGLPYRFFQRHLFWQPVGRTRTPAAH